MFKINLKQAQLLTRHLLTVKGDDDQAWEMLKLIINDKTMTSAFRIDESEDGVNALLPTIEALTEDRMIELDKYLEWEFQHYLERVPFDQYEHNVDIEYNDPYGDNFTILYNDGSYTTVIDPSIIHYTDEVNRIYKYYPIETIRTK